MKIKCLIFITLLAVAGTNALTAQGLLGKLVKAVKKKDPGAELRDAAIRGDLKLVKKLVEQGTPVDTALTSGKDVDGFSLAGKTALMFAAQFGYPQVCQYLLEKGAKVNKKTNDGMTAIIWAGSSESVQVSKVLLSYGAKINAATNKGITALMTAANNGKLALCHYLVENGANCAAKSSDGMTAYDFLISTVGILTGDQRQDGKQLLKRCK
ncbi:MAG: ankyrin repeat domain-containing protein [Bacteroidia bacterium]